MNRLKSWLIGGAAALLLAGGLSRLRFEVDVLDLLPVDLRVVQGLKLHQAHFASSGELILTLEGRDPELTERAAETLAEALEAAPGLAQRVTWRSSWEDDPSGPAELLAFLWLNQPADPIATLAERLQPLELKEAFLTAREELATSLSPDALGRLAYDPLRLSAVPATGVTGGGLGFDEASLYTSADGRFRLVLVRPAEPPGSYRQAAAWLGGIREAVNGWRDQHPELAGLEVGLTGQPAFMAEIGGGMERDLTRSVTGVFLFITLLFGWAHRTWAPLVKLLLILLLILAVTLAVGGLAFGTLNVVSAGFAAMLLALAVDFGLVLYQESRISLGRSLSEVRGTLGPGIWWAAVTTAGAFLAAGLAHLPGLAEMGLLVGMGILLAAAIMIHLYLPWVHRRGSKALSEPSAPQSTEGSPESGVRDSKLEEEDRMRAQMPERGARSARGKALPPSSPAPFHPALWFTAMLSLVAVGILATGLPAVDSGTDALNPTDSQAFAAARRIRDELGQLAEPLWVVVSAGTDRGMIHRLRESGAALDQAKAAGEISSYQLPTALWPELDRQRANRTRLAAALPSEESLQAAARDAGFNEQSLTLAQAVFRSWREAADAHHLWWPSSPLARETLNRVIDRSAVPFHALGLTYPSPAATAGTDALADRLDGLPGVWLTNWDLLGQAVAGHVRRDMQVIIPIVAVLLLVTLSLTFRRTTEILLGLAALALSLALLHAVMRLMGWSWNLMNFVALPVLLGTGVDYGIHIQLALRRHTGNLVAVRRGVGRALLLCGATTLAGFGSLAFSSNAGLASLGRLCAIGIFFVVTTTVFLLPHWWLRCHRRRLKLPP